MTHPLPAVTATPTRRPNPLTDELSDEAKAALAVAFAAMADYLGPLQINVCDRPHRLTERLLGR